MESKNWRRGEVGRGFGVGVWSGMGEGVVCQLKVVLFGLCKVVWDEWGEKWIVSHYLFERRG
jgi:hypothetical protein